MRRSTLLSSASAIALALLVSAPLLAADQDGDLLRDSFETRWGVTDPTKADTDGDGVVDSAEDNDNDRLSDLGEQRFGTNPGRRDSDGDGRSDGNEDNDRDGRSNALEQDQRPVPRPLKPVLSKAKTNYPEGRFRCQTEQGKSNVLPCKFGTENSDTTVALFGDSHAGQWIPSLDRAGEREGWQIVQLTKSACPSISAHAEGQWKLDRDRTCTRWRQNVFRWLKANKPELIVITNRSKWTLVDGRGRKIPRSRHLAAWRAAMARTLAAMPASSKVMVLSDTPRMNGEPVKCLLRNRNNISACTTQRSKALGSRIRKVERQAAKAAGAATRNMNDKICTYDPCPLVHGRVLVWRDHGHLTATFNRLLWPTMRDRLRSAAAGALD